MDLISY